MTRKPDEIKKGLECCYSSVEPIMRCEQCPYYGSVVCKMRLHTDAIALIQQLEAQNAEQAEKTLELYAYIGNANKNLDCLQAKLETKLDSVEAGVVQLIQYCKQLEAAVSEKEKVVAELSGKIGQLEAERDAAVNDLHYLVNHPLSAGPCYACLHSKDCWRGGDCDPVNNDRWQWRGIYKEEH